MTRARMIDLAVRHATTAAQRRFLVMLLCGGSDRWWRDRSEIVAIRATFASLARHLDLEAA